MTDRPLSPANPADVRETLSYGLRYSRAGRRTHDRADLMADAAAEHLMEHLERNGFVIMRKAPLAAHAGPVPEHARSTE